VLLGSRGKQITYTRYTDIYTIKIHMIHKKHKIEDSDCYIALCVCQRKRKGEERETEDTDRKTENRRDTDTGTDTGTDRGREVQVFKDTQR